MRAPRAVFLLVLLPCLGLASSLCAGVPAGPPAPVEESRVVAFEAAQLVVLVDDGERVLLLVDRELRVVEVLDGAAGPRIRKTHARAIALTSGTHARRLSPLAADPRRGYALCFYGLAYVRGEDPVLSRRASAHYGYASGDPVSRVDPMGMFDAWAYAKGLGRVIIEPVTATYDVFQTAAGAYYGIPVEEMDYVSMSAQAAQGRRIEAESELAAYRNRSATRIAFTTVSKAPAEVAATVYTGGAYGVVKSDVQAYRDFDAGRITIDQLDERMSETAGAQTGGALSGSATSRAMGRGWTGRNTPLGPDEALFKLREGETAVVEPSEALTAKMVDFRVSEGLETALVRGEGGKTYFVMGRYSETAAGEVSYGNVPGFESVEFHTHFETARPSVFDLGTVYGRGGPGSETVILHPRGAYFVRVQSARAAGEGLSFDYSMEGPEPLPSPGWGRGSFDPLAFFKYLAGPRDTRRHR